MKNSRLALIGASLVASLSAVTGAATVPVDGIIEASYGAAVKVYADNYINGTDASGGTNVISTFFTFDNDYVYAAVRLDSGAAAFNGANVYIYSSGANVSRTTGLAGVYGSGDDFIAEGSNGWLSALGAAPWGTGPQAYSPGSVNYVYNDTTKTVEVSIARSMLGDYETFRFGGQFFGYEFHRGTGDRVSGANVAVSALVAPVPLPTAATAGLSLLGLTALRRRR